MSDPLEDNFINAKDEKKCRREARRASGPKPQKTLDQNYNFTTKEFTQPGDPTYGHLRSYFHQSKDASPFVGSFFTHFAKILKRIGVKAESSKEDSYLVIELRLPEAESSQSNNKSKKKSKKATKKELTHSDPLPTVVVAQSINAGERVLYRERRIASKEELNIDLTSKHYQWGRKQSETRWESESFKQQLVLQFVGIVWRTEFFFNSIENRHRSWLLVIDRQEKVEPEAETNEETNEETSEEEEGKQLEVVSVVQAMYYGAKDREPTEGWTQIHSLAGAVIYGYDTPESLLIQQMSETPLIEDGKAKVQQIRDRQNEKKKKSRERKTTQKQTLGMKGVRDDWDGGDD